MKLTIRTKLLSTFILKILIAAGVLLFSLAQMDQVLRNNPGSD